MKPKNTLKIDRKGVYNLEKDVLGSYTTLGDLLKDKRKEKHLEISDIVKFTRIREHYIEALEENNYAVLPERTYALGYLRAYAKLLDLPNVEELVSYLDKSYKFDGISYNDNNSSKTKTLLELEETMKIQPTKKSRSSKKTLLFLGLLVVIILGLIVYFTKKSNSNIEVMKNNEKEFSDVTKEKNYLVVDKNKDSNQTAENDNTNINSNKTEDASVGENNDNVKSTTKDDSFIVITKWPKETLEREVIIEFNEDVWAKIYNGDNKDVYLVRNFRKGQQYTVPGVENLKLDLGNYKGVRFIIDGDVYTIPPKSNNSVVMNNINLSKDNIIDNFDKE